MIKYISRGFLLGIFLFLAPFFSVYSQIAEVMDGVLDVPELSYAQAARFVLAASETLPVAVSAGEAFMYARQQNWIPGAAQAEGPITMGALSLLIMKSFKIPGGFMYALFPSGRYAYRTMVRRSFIDGVADQAMRVSGEEFFLILGNVLSYKGGDN